MTNIKFKDLELINFRIHESLKVDFSTNKLVVVTGKNGSGKTSIIDAIVWALYDETVKGQKGDAVVTKKIGKNCSVILKFDIDDISYEIQRYYNHKKFKNTKILLRNGKKISNDSDIKETNNIIENLIMTKDLFLNCMLFSQYIKKSFTTLTHAGQKEILDSLLSFDKYDEYYKSITEKITENTNQINDLTTQIRYQQDFIDDITLTINNMTIELENITNLKDQKLKEKTEELNILLNKKKHTKFDENKYKKSISDKEKLLEERSNIQSEITNIDVHLESEKSKIKLEIEKQCNEEIQDIRQQKESESLKYNDDLKANKNSLVVLENKRVSTVLEHKNKTSKSIDDYKNENKSKIEIIENELNQLTDTINQLTSKLEISEYKVNTIDSRINEFNTNDISICPTCKQSLKGSNKEHIEKEINSLYEQRNIELDNIKKYNAKLNNLDSQYNSMKSGLDTLNSDIILAIDSMNETLKDEIEKTNNRASIYKSEIENIIIQLENELSKISNKYNSIEETIKSKYTEQYSKKVSSLLTDCDKKKLSLTKKVDEINDKLNKQQLLIDSLFSEKLEFESLTNNIKSKEDLIHEITHNYENRQEAINNSITENKIKIKNHNEKLSLNTELINSRNKEIDVLKFWKVGFSDVGIKSILLDECIPILNKKARELSELTEILRVSFSSQTTLKSGKSNNKFSIDAIHSKNLSEYNELSAGETRMVNIIILLCLRHLLEYMNGMKINILLLDEILDSLDEDNSEIAVKIMNELSNEYLVLLITHTHKAWIHAKEEIRL